MEVTQTAAKIEDCINIVESLDVLSTRPKNLQVITAFTTLFAKWLVTDEGLLVQLFARKGPEDQWYRGRWVNKTYVPGRGEIKSGLEFPKDFEQHIKKGVDGVWLGEVKLDFVEELCSYVLLFEGCFDAKAYQEGQMLDKFLEYLDNVLDSYSHNR